MGQKYNEKEYIVDTHHPSYMVPQWVLVHSCQSFISFQHLPRSCKGESVKSNMIYIYLTFVPGSLICCLHLVSSWFFLVLFSPVVLNVVSSQHSFWHAPHLCFSSDHSQNVRCGIMSFNSGKRRKVHLFPSPLPRNTKSDNFIPKG